MVSTILTAVLVVILAIFLGLFVFLLKKLRDAQRSFITFVSPRGEGQTSPLADMTAAIAAQMGESLKASIMGQASVTNKNLKRVEGAIMADMLGQANPLLGMALDKFPQLSKLVQKNPGAAQMVMGLLGSRNGTGPPGDSGVTPTNGGSAWTPS